MMRDGKTPEEERIYKETLERQRRNVSLLYATLIASGKISEADLKAVIALVDTIPYYGKQS